MNKNSYVTAALFAVFVLLTVVYWNMPSDGTAPTPSLTGDMLTSETDASTASELVASEEVGEEEEVNDSELETETEVEEQEEENTNATVENSTETASSIQALRSELAKQRSQQASALMEIIASPDHDAETKSVAKDDLNQLERITNSQDTLETMIKSMGFSDVLVRADEESVRVVVQVPDLEAAPTREELAELYVLAELEFVNQDHISIQIQPVS